jgi:hypothetical protein
VRPTSDPRDRVLARARPDGECWLLDGAASDARGYRIVRHDGRKDYAHRLVVGLENIPVGHEVDHICQRPSCVRPSHLQVVTVSEHRSRHSREMWKRRRQA